MRTSLRFVIVSCCLLVMSFFFPLCVESGSNIKGFPDNPNQMDTFPFYVRPPHLFVHPPNNRNVFVPTFSYDEFGERYIDWEALENIDMRTLSFRVKLSTNYMIYHWMEPVYLTATITGEDLNIFRYLNWKVYGLGTIPDTGTVSIVYGVGVSTARQILPNPYITHLVFYLYFPSGQVHVSSHIVEIGNRPIRPRVLPVHRGIDNYWFDTVEGNKYYIELAKTSDVMSVSFISVTLLVSSSFIFFATLSAKNKNKELKS